MIIAASREQASHRRRVNEVNANRLDASGNSTASARTPFIGLDPPEVKGKPIPDPDVLSPMAFLIEEDPHSVLNAHFHKADQFQIFIKGDGKIANHAIESICIQYSGAYTAYGPIVAGPKGLSYFTLRNTYTAKAYFMPASRDELRAGKRQHREVFSDIAAPRTEAALAAASKVEASTVIEKTADGLGVWRYLVPPGQTAAGPDPRDGGSQFWMVLSGGMADSGSGPMDPTSCVFVSPEEAAYVATAGAKGLDVLVAQFPAKPFS